MTMSYVFRIGERVTIAASAGRNPGSKGRILERLPGHDISDAQGLRADMVRVRLDDHPRPLLFLARDVNPS